MAKIEILPQVSVIENSIFKDNRGEIYTLWNQNDIPHLKFNHDKISRSKYKVLRGLHTDKSWKLITCIYGRIQLVIVDFLNTSSNYLNWCDFVLDSLDSQKKSILIPPGFLNGHLVLSDEAVFHYKWSYQGNYPDIKDQVSVKWNDPKISIKWILEEPILSERDKNSNLL